MAVLTSRRRYSNVAPQATLLAPLNASATTFGISTGTGFPAVPFTAILDYQSPGEEVILVTGLSGTTITGCTRGYDGSTAQTHATGALFVHGAVARDYDEANDHTSSTVAHGTTGGLVGLTDTQTLTNKTLSSSKGQATATDPALRLQAFASGVAALLEGYASNGTTLEFQVNKAGDTKIILNDSSKVGLSVQGAASQATDLLRLLNSAAATLLAASQTGRITHRPSDLAGAAYKYVPPSSTAAQFLALRDTGDAADQFVLTNAGEISSAAKLWLRGFFADDPIRLPLDGSLFKVDQNGNIVTAGTLTADTVITDDVVRRIAYASSSTTSGTTASEAKDGSLGDVAFTAVAGRKYRIVYHARCEATGSAISMDLRVRDGGGSSPGTGSTLLASASAGTVPTTGADFREVRAEALVTGLSAGTHTIAGFLAVTSGSGNARVGQATGGTRELMVYDEGTV